MSKAVKEGWSSVGWLENRDKRPQKDAWAPGMYICYCKACGKGFIGDKRALICGDCAYGESEGRKVEG